MFLFSINDFGNQLINHYAIKKYNVISENLTF